MRPKQHVLQEVIKYKMRKKNEAKEHIEEPTSIFKRRRRYNISDQHLVSREESEQRLQLGCIGLAITLVIACSIITVVYSLTVKVKLPTILTPSKREEQNPLQGFPVPHVALVYEDGSIYDISLHEKISPSKNFLFKLSRDKGYFGYADQFGVLHFISSSITRKITRYHDSFGHKIIPKSDVKRVNPMDSFGYGLQVGNKFWVWGIQYKENQILDQTQFRPATYLWYIKKQQWKPGPKIKKFFQPSAATAINASHAMIVTKATNSKLHTFVYDFDSETWPDYPLVETPILYSQNFKFIGEFSLATFISKQDRKVYLSCLLHSLNPDGQSIYSVKDSERIVLSYDLALGGIGNWIFEVHTDLNKHYDLYRQLLLATNGKLLSFDSVAQQESVGYAFQNGEWIKLNASLDKIPDTSLPIYAIPYIVRV